MNIIQNQDKGNNIIHNIQEKENNHHTRKIHQK